MAEIQPLKKTHQTNPRSSCFLSCFGFSAKQKPLQTKKTRSLYWPMFRLSSRKSRIKTVPIDNTDKAEAADHSKTKTSELMKKTPDDSMLSSKPRTQKSPTNHKPSRQSSKADRQLASTNQAATARETTQEIRSHGPEPNLILRKSKLSNPTRTGSSLPGSPNIKPRPKTQSKLSQTVSFSVLEGNQQVGNPPINARVNSKELQMKSSQVVEKLDTMMGMSIIVVTLIIMLLWGSSCAILCTSVWFYFCPRSRTRIKNNDSNVQSTANSNDLYLNSDEYKKKVVLEGLLQRNHRITL